MKTYVYPGSFCPPTFGHLEIAKNVAEFVGELIIICSVNQDKKNNWFSEQEAKEMWNSYELPKNVNIVTLEEFKKMQVNREDIIMIRGIRDKSDLEYERDITMYNKEHFGITKYMYIFSEAKYENTSSTKARLLAESLEIEELSEYVSFFVISRLLEKVLGLDNLFMVTGRPGSGKSTILRMLKEQSSSTEYINTDDFNKELKSLLEAEFKTRDLVSVAMENEESLKRVIVKPWMILLKQSLKSIPKTCKNLFVEVPYGLQEDKKVYRFLGGKILYIYCNREEEIKRITQRGNVQIIPFIEKIPDLFESINICNKNKLEMISINTDCEINQLKQRLQMFYSSLKKEEAWKTFLQKSY